MSYKYIGQPYTAFHPDGSPDLELMEYRYEKGAEVTAQLLSKGIFVYSPIVHCHELAKKYDLPRDFEFWQHYNRAMLKQSCGFAILKLDGWKFSKGLFGEREFAIQMGLPLINVERLLHG